MSKWDKLIVRICNLSKNFRFDELKKVLESCGYVMNNPRSGTESGLFITDKNHKQIVDMNY